MNEDGAAPDFNSLVIDHARKDFPLLQAKMSAADAMVLGINESVSTQSMSVTIQALRSASVTWRWFAGAFRREFITALLTGIACGLLVGVVVWLWRNDRAGALIIGGSVAISLVRG